MQGSLVLRGVIATLASVGVVSPESSESYCTEDGTYCHVFGNDPDNGDVIIGEEPDPYDPAMDGTNWLGGDSSTVDPYCQDAGCDESPRPQICEFIADEASDSCDLNSPPPLLMNGCGSGWSTHLVADSLLVPWTVEYSVWYAGHPTFTSGPFGSLFTLACNSHDRCYGTLGEGKLACDKKLGDDMIDRALSVMTPEQEQKYMEYARQQARAYENALTNPYVDYYFSRPAYDAAQAEAKCRVLSQHYQDNGC